MAKILPPDQGEGFQIVLKIAPADIDFLTRVVEGLDGMGMVSTVDPALGLVVVWVTPDIRDDVLGVLASFPRPVEVLQR